MKPLTNSLDIAKHMLKPLEGRAEHKSHLYKLSKHSVVALRELEQIVNDIVTVSISKVLEDIKRNQEQETFNNLISKTEKSF